MASGQTHLKIHRTSFHERLKHATRPIHHRIEAQLPLVDSHITPVRYRAVLRTFFGFYVPLETCMQASSSPALLADVTCRRKSRWLLEDLMSMGDSIEVIGTLPHCQELPPMATQADVIGALYVAEGATLGGQIILKNLRNALGSNADRSVRFINSYGAQVLDMWNAFLRRMEAAAYDELQAQAIIASAYRTFTSFEQWLVLNHIGEDLPGPARVLPYGSRSAT